MKLGKLIDSIQGINMLLNMKLSPDKAFDLMYFVKTAENEIKSYNELRTNAIKEMGVHAEDGSYTVPKESVEKFNEFMVVLNDRESVVVPPRFKPSDIKEDIDTVTLMKLDYLFEDPTPATEEEKPKKKKKK